MTPSAIDFELQSLCLGPEDDDGASLLNVTLEWIRIELFAGTNFELVQAYLNRVLKLHGETLRQRPELYSKLHQLNRIERKIWRNIQGMLQHNLCLISFFSHQH
mmetsp:Transcript_11657/g.14539  ORF Transcript_11657/g.14539 Transcript_11657/m.14539 type:complete len:104 (-) Transcript_11657:1950-2261(-)